MKPLLFCVLALTLISNAYSQLQQGLGRITHANGATQDYLVLRDASAAPKRLIAMFGGGSGQLGLAQVQEEVVAGSQGFVPTSRGFFVRDGTVVVLLNTPSSQPNMTIAYRRSKAFVDMAEEAVRSIAKQTPNVPLILLGFSNGSYTVADLADRMKDELAAGILVSSTLPTLAAFPSRDIKAPLLIVHHERDECLPTPKNSALLQKVRVVLVQDRDIAYMPGKCGLYTAHHMHGQERVVIDTIFQWLATKEAPATIR
ncbi:MAG: alpha/beta hydrolase [Burkholderiaceae bacterium]